MKKLIYSSVCWMWLLLLTSGCVIKTFTTAKPKGTEQTKETLLVLPFENLASSRFAGLNVTELSITILQAQGHFFIKDASLINLNSQTQLRKLEVTSWENQIAIDTSHAIHLGKLANADFVLCGVVNDYGYVDGLGETATVGITVRLIEVKSGLTIWTGSISERSACSPFNQESIQRLAHNSLIELYTKMENDLCGKHNQPLNIRPGVLKLSK